MKRPLIPLIAAALAGLASMETQAVPVKYDLVFEASAPGSGSFHWDENAGTIIDFEWDLGAGLTGRLSNEIDWLAPVLGGTRGGFFFELITGEDAHPSGCDAIDACGASFLGNEVSGFPSVLASFSRNNQIFDSARYFFLGTDSRILSGDLIATRAPVSVSESGTLVMLMSGLLAAGALFRRRHTRAVASSTCRNTCDESETSSARHRAPLRLRSPSGWLRWRGNSGHS